MKDDTKNAVKLAAIFYAARTQGTIKDENMVFSSVDPKEAETILLALMNEKVLEEDFTTYAKRHVERRYETVQVEVSREWDSRAPTISGDHGDWNIKYANRQKLASETHSIVYPQPGGERPVDICYDEKGKVLNIALWAISAKPLYEALNPKQTHDSHEDREQKEKCLRAVLACAAPETRNGLHDIFNEVRALKPLQPEKSIDLQAIQDYSAKVSGVVNRVSSLLQDSGVTKIVDSPRLSKAVRIITGRDLKLAA